MRLRPVIVLAALGLATAASAPPRAALAAPSASEKKLAKEMLAEAVDDEKAGKCDDAIGVLRQVMQIQETAEALLHLGICLEKTGKLTEALKTWEHGEDVARSDKDKATQQALLPKLAALRDRIPALALQLPADVKASVSVDGQAIPAGRTGVPIPLDPGEHTVEAKADGRAPFSKKITLAEKDSKVMVVDLPSPDAPKPGEPPKRGGVPIGTWIAGSAALVLTAGGVVSFVVAGSTASSGAAQCAKQAQCDAGTVKSVHALDAAALGLWIGAGVGAGLAVTLFVLDRKGKPAGAPAPSARLVVGPGSLGLAGSF
jgi:hypothetical protein